MQCSKSSGLLQTPAAPTGFMCFDWCFNDWQQLVLVVGLLEQ